MTAHFLRPVSVGPVEIHVRRLRTGQWLTNLTSELVQGVRLVIHNFPHVCVKPGDRAKQE